MSGTVQGKTHTWQVSDTPIGSGDAGEVYAVTCLEQPELNGVLKTPAHIATGGTIQRQANQIAQEGLALAHLDGLPQCKAHPPLLLDAAPERTSGTANYFIVSEAAPGENLAEMLTQYRQSGKPFPRRVIITILDALFDLFARAHRAGVLWNDVKLDHIYWHNPSGSVAVIDWGNAIFLDEENQQQHALPRWEDYQQLVETLGSFLQQNAPDLFDDLGWEEFQGLELDSPRVSVLARRIAYQQQVIALRVMEYQSLMRVVLSAKPTLEGLQKIQAYHQELEKIGAPRESHKVLDYSRQFVLTALESRKSQHSLKAATIIWDLFDQSLGLSWHLLREYFRHPDMLSHPLMPVLAKNTLYENWSTALWTLISIAQETQPGIWWDKIMPVLRQKAFNLIVPPPYQTCLSALSWVEAQGEKTKSLPDKLNEIREQWREKGANLEGNPFDYELFDLLRSERDLPRRLQAELNQNFAAGQVVIRELLQAWKQMSWDDLPDALHRAVGWDPDRWGIIHLAKAIEDFKAWLSRLQQGPTSHSEPQQFIQELLDERPPVEQLLGTPAWLIKLQQTLTAILAGSSISQHKAEVQAWCPWVLTVQEDEQPNE